MLFAIHTQRKLKLQAKLKGSGALDRTAKTGRLSAKAGPEELLKIILDALGDAKAEDIVTIPLDGKAALADNMVIASGRSNRHVASITDKLVEKLKQGGFKDLRIEGQPHCDWVLVDAIDTIAHIFRPEVRSFYNLEKLWSPDAPGDQPVS